MNGKSRIRLAMEDVELAPPGAQQAGGTRSTSSLESAGPAAPWAKEDLHTVSDLHILEVKAYMARPAACGVPYGEMQPNAVLQRRGPGICRWL